MKKVVLALIVSMLAVPALAGVTVDCTVVTDSNEVIVTYVAGDANLPRAFGLDIIADANISIDSTLPSADINDSDYYIYPGSIDVNDDTGDVDDYGSPVAILDANTMTIEMGSLYTQPPADDDPDHNTPPPASGWLIKFRVNKNPSETINVDLRENVDRGGVVMEKVGYSFPGGYVVCGDCTNEGGGPYTISGTVTYMGSGLDGVTMNGLPSAPVTAGGGLYSDNTVPEHWSGTVTPSKTGSGFKPTSRPYPDVISDQVDQDYCAYPGCWDWPGQCHGDTVDNDLSITLADFFAFKDAYQGAYDPCADYDRDGSVTLGDFFVFKDGYTAGTVPGDCTQGDINNVYGCGP